MSIPVRRRAAATAVRLRRAFAAVLAAALLAVAGAGGAPAATGLVPEAMSVLQREYVAPEQLVPLRLLHGALEEAEAAFSPVLYVMDAGRSPPTLRLRVGSASFTRRLSGLESLEALLKLLDELQAFLQSRLPASFAPETVPAVLVEGMLGTLDPHSRLLDGEAYEAFQNQTAGHFGGVGLTVGRDEADGLVVQAVLPDSPAARAGVRPGTRIVRIDQAVAWDLRPERAVHLIRGLVDTPVTLYLLPPGQQQPRRVTLRRSDIRVPSVESRRFETSGGYVGYLRLRSFQQSTAWEVRQHVGRLEPETPGFMGLVLDLRGNPGGILEQAIRVADLFLDRGLIVTVERPGQEPDPVQARWYRSLIAAPMTVLIDEETASAAEIVAAALKYNHRAVLLGTPTFGKGSVQSLLPLSGGYALKLTIARFHTAGDRPIQPQGIVPHFGARPVTVSAGHVNLRPDAPAVGDEPAADRDALATLVYLAEERGAPLFLPALPLPDKETLDRDVPLSLARTILFYNNDRDYPALVRGGLTVMETEARRQRQRIVERLAQLGVDWRPGVTVQGGHAALERVRVEVREGPDADWYTPTDGLVGGHQVRLTVTVRNTGDAPLFRVLGVLNGSPAALDSLELPFGALPAGAERSWQVVAPLPRDLPWGWEPLRIHLRDGHGQRFPEARLFVPLQQPARPAVALRWQIHEDGRHGSAGNGDGRLQAGERLALRVLLRNAGDAPLPSTVVMLSAPPGGPVELQEAVHAVPPLAPGQDARVTLLARVNDPLSGGRIPLTVDTVTPGHAALRLHKSLHLRPGQPLPAGTIQPPLIELHPAQPVQAGPVLQLKGQLRDDGTPTAVILRRDGRKIAYHTGEGPRDRADVLPFRLEVPLHRGRNLIVLEGRDDDGLVVRRRMTFWRGRRDGLSVGELAEGPR